MSDKNDNLHVALWFGGAGWYAECALRSFRGLRGFLSTADHRSPEAALSGLLIPGVHAILRRASKRLLASCTLQERLWAPRAPLMLQAAHGRTCKHRDQSVLERIEAMRWGSFRRARMESIYAWESRTLCFRPEVDEAFFMSVSPNLKRYNDTIKLSSGRGGRNESARPSRKSRTAGKPGALRTMEAGRGRVGCSARRAQALGGRAEKLRWCVAR